MKKCPNCGQILEEGGLNWAEHGRAWFKLRINENGHLEHEFNDFDPDEVGKGKFICSECGTQLDLTEKEVIDIILGKE
jgi:ribosomal protein S27AE